MDGDQTIQRSFKTKWVKVSHARFLAIPNRNNVLNKYFHQTELQPESEKPRQRVSNADRKVFANPESFCNKLIICWRISGYFGKCPDTIQNIQIICKVGMNWKFSIWCKKCPDNLKNVSGYSKKSLDNVKMYLENLEGSGWS